VPTATLVAPTDPSSGGLPEGLAVRDAKAYLGFAPTSQIVELELAGGAATPYSTLPTPVAGKGFMTGLAFGGADLYAALVSFVPEVQAGIYRAAERGKPATLFAKHAEMAFPNGLAFDQAGQLYVADSAAGAVFRATPSGDVAKWAADPLLAGGKDSCGPEGGVGVPFDIGANGIVVNGGAIYVTNTDKGTVVRIPVLADGSSGAPALFAGPSCADLSGADGLAVDPDGNLVAADNHLNKIVRIDRGGKITTVVEGAPLDFPASVAFVGRTLYASNFAFLNAGTDKAKPGLVRVSGY
jgi:DNA-binding beta-propeller fold protein YncE